jgi:hypothetical protein
MIYAFAEWGAISFLLGHLASSFVKGANTQAFYSTQNFCFLQI